MPMSSHKVTQEGGNFANITHVRKLSSRLQSYCSRTSARSCSSSSCSKIDLPSTILYFQLWAIFRLFTSAMDWLKSNKYFHVVVKGVERDGWKFVLLARFSPLPSYIINYALSATDVGFFKDFLLPTVVGCLPMILQNVSIVSLAGAAVASTTGSEKSRIYSYLFPVLGIMSSILISCRIKQYSSALVIPEELKKSSTNGKANMDDKPTSELSKNTKSGETRKRR